MEEKTFDDICFQFKEKIIEIFNTEQNIPFLLKYYLIKDIWDSIEEHKINIELNNKSKKLKPITQTLDLQTGEVTTEENDKEDLTN